MRADRQHPRPGCDRATDHLVRVVGERGQIDDEERRGREVGRRADRDRLRRGAEDRAPQAILPDEVLGQDGDLGRQP